MCTDYYGMNDYEPTIKVSYLDLRKKAIQLIQDDPVVNKDELDDLKWQISLVCAYAYFYGSCLCELSAIDWPF